MSTVIESMLSVAAFVMVLSAIAGAVSVGFSSYYASISTAQGIVEKSNERVRSAAVYMDGKLYVGFRNTGVRDVTVVAVHAFYPWYRQELWRGYTTLGPGSHYILGPLYTWGIPTHVVVETSRGVYSISRVVTLSSSGGFIGYATPSDLWGQTFAVDVGIGHMAISTSGYFIAFATYSTKDPYSSDVFSSIAPESRVAGRGSSTRNVVNLGSTSWASHIGAVEKKDNSKQYYSGITMSVSGWYRSLSAAACAGYAFETQASFPAVLHVFGGRFTRFTSSGSLNLTYFDVIAFTRNIDPRHIATYLLAGYPPETSMDPGAGGVAYVVVMRCFRISYEYPRQEWIEVRSGDFNNLFRVYARGSYMGFGIGVLLGRGSSGGVLWETGYPTIAVSYIPPQVLVEAALFS